MAFDTANLFYGGLGAAGAALISVAIIVVIALYIYHAMAWMTIWKKLKHKRPWLAWIPFANVALIFQLGGFHWAWVFLFLIPVLGWIAIFVMVIIATWRVYEQRKYPGWLALIMLASLIPVISATFLFVILLPYFLAVS